MNLSPSDHWMEHRGLGYEPPAPDEHDEVPVEALRDTDAEAGAYEQEHPDR